MSNLSTVTNDEIMRYSRVPVSVAAQYLGVTPQYIRSGIKAGILPIGSSMVLSRKKRTYHISPYRLIEYQTGQAIAGPDVAGSGRDDE